jgi:hypothetical protein
MANASGSDSPALGAGRWQQHAGFDSGMKYLDGAAE